MSPEDLERAYINLFAGHTAPPRYRKKCLGQLRYPQALNSMAQGLFAHDRLVEFWQSRALDGTIKNVTVSRQGKHWFVAFQVEMEMPEPTHLATAHVGIDLGVATFAAFSDGSLHPPLNAYRRAAKKKARMQRRLAGMVKYSQTGRNNSNDVPNLACGVRPWSMEG